jgi:thiamine-monophosphate kinase
MKRGKVRKTSLKKKSPEKLKRSPRKRANEKKKRDQKQGLSLDAFGELRFIQEIKSHYSGFKRATRNVGIGDDCSIIGTAARNDILVTTDTQMDGVHFNSKLISPEHIGERSVAITLSDIAAMGGHPQYLFLNLGLPKTMDSNTAFKIMSGVHRACESYKVSLLGGDTFGSPKGAVLCLMALGKIARGKAVSRSGAKVRDEIFLTGTVGASALGLALLRSGFKNISKKGHQESKFAIQRHCRPVPHLAEGKFFSQEGFANAMIDISDGLSADLYNLCQASRVGAVIYESFIPLDPALSHFVKDRRRALRMSLSGGEDYCLLLTIPKKKSAQAMRKFQKRFSRKLCKIGEIVPVKKGFHLVSRSGKVRALSRQGYEHFRKSIHEVKLPMG